jgi:hypothetical protein
MKRDLLATREFRAMAFHPGLKKPDFHHKRIESSGTREINRALWKECPYTPR